MKKIIIAALCLVFLAWPAAADYRWSQDFLAVAVNVAANTAATNGAEFTSVNINIANQAGTGAITVTFARAAGTAATVDFAFEISTDGGATYATFEGGTISVATQHAVISGTTVRVAYLVDLGGVSHIRLKSITNNDLANNITAANVKISF